MENILLSVLSTTLNKDSEELQGLLFEDGKNEKGEPSKVLKPDADKIAIKQITDWYSRKETEWRSKNKTIAGDKYGQGKKEASELFEKIIGETTGFKSDELKGEEFVREALSFAVKHKDSADFKTNPEFLKYESETKKQYELRMKELQDKFDSERNNWNKEKVFEGVSSKIILRLEKMNPILPQSVDAKNTQLNLFKNSFKEFEFKDNQNGSFHVWKDGERLEKLGVPIELDEFVETQAKKFFDFEKQDPKKTTGGSGDGSVKVTICSTKEEYNKAMSEAKSPQERVALLKAHESKNWI